MGVRRPGMGLRAGAALRTARLARPARAAGPVDVALVPAADVSRSITADRFEHPPEGLQGGCRSNVVGGHGAFVLVARDFSSFGRSRVVKPVQEIS